MAWARQGLQEQIIIILGFAFAFALASLSVRWCMLRFAEDEWWEQIKEKMSPLKGRCAHEREDMPMKGKMCHEGEDVVMKGKMRLVKGGWERTGRLGNKLQTSWFTHFNPISSCDILVWASL